MSLSTLSSQTLQPHVPCTVPGTVVTTSCKPNQTNLADGPVSLNEESQVKNPYVSPNTGPVGPRTEKTVSFANSAIWVGGVLVTYCVWFWCDTCLIDTGSIVSVAAHTLPFVVVFGRYCDSSSEMILAVESCVFVGVLAQYALLIVGSIVYYEFPAQS